MKRTSGRMLATLAGALMLASPSAWACTFGTGVLERDIPQAFHGSPEVFVARLLNYRERLPRPGGFYYLATADYEVVEVLKGHPPAHGTLLGGTTWRLIPGAPNPPPPPPPCGPEITSKDMVGQTALIFATPEPYDDTSTFRLVHPYSWGLSPLSSPFSQDLLNLARNLKATDPRP